MPSKTYNGSVKADPVKLARRRLLKLAARRRYRAAHAEEIKAHRMANAEKVRGYNARYRAAHPERVKAYDAAYKAAVQLDPKKRAKKLAKHRLYLQLHSEQCIAYESRRRKRIVVRLKTELFWAVTAAVPKNMPASDRDDIIMAATELALRTISIWAIFRKRVAFHHIALDDPRITAAVAAALKGHRRMFDYFKTRSLDAPIGEGGFTLMDILAAPNPEEADEVT